MGEGLASVSRAITTVAMVIALSSCASTSVGMFESGDVGAVGIAGSAVFDAESGVYRVTGGGANLWGAEDAFHYAATRGEGNLHIATNVEWVGEGGDPHRKAGPVMRQNLIPGSPYVDLMVHGDGLVSLQYRDVQDGPTFQIQLSDAATPPRRVRLEVEDGYVYASLSGPDGALVHAGGNYRLPFEGPYYAGLAVSAHNNALTETAIFSDVEMMPPTLAHIADPGYPAAVEATLEVIEIAGGQYGAGNRRVVRHFNGKIEAPNWSRDGTYLLYNSSGLIYRIPVEGGEPRVVNTGPLIRNNNDHGISPDGTQLIISDQSQPDNISRIYLLPIEGSDSPREVVSHATARSYWHAWTPDGRTIAYTASRPDVTGHEDYDIWAKDLAGGAERNLTNHLGLDDGPEYAPDGRLYWNSVRSGHMAIWRADADGSNPQQLTFDTEYRDWFPHISPDGRWIVFLSFYAEDVDLSDHPPNRSVVLRMMPTDGSEPPRVLTRFFGGQGTINVPSWSPDSRHLAFVSYRLVR